MSDTLGNLGEMFPNQQVKCRIRGCDHTFEVSGERAISNIAQGKSVSAGMCKECSERLQTLSDKEMPCSTPGCQGTWIWNRYQQLEAYARAKGQEPKTPHGLCPQCREKVTDFQPMAVPCRVKSCKNTWTWSPREQFLAAGKPAPQRFCDECFKKFNELKDITLKCRVRGCEQPILWTRSMQLEYWRSGHSLDKLPLRMCNDCLKLFNSLKNEERPCKIKGCSGTWMYTAFEQLESLRKSAEGETVKEPQRMCRDCFEFLNNAKDIEQPCKQAGCSHTWVWTRSKQLADHVRGIDEPKPHFCPECDAKFKAAAEARAKAKAEQEALQNPAAPAEVPPAPAPQDASPQNPM